MLGISAETEVRPVPGTTPAKRAARKAERAAQAAMLQTGGFDEALVRAVLFVSEADHAIDERSALALNVVRQKLMHLPLAAFKALVRNQFFVLQLDGDRAITALASMVPEFDARADLLDHVVAIASAGAPPTAATRERLAQLAEMLPIASEKPAAVAGPERPVIAAASDKPAATGTPEKSAAVASHGRLSTRTKLRKPTAVE
jgi:hypothetical protein